MSGKCKDCKHWNDFQNTYVKADYCCSYWHTAYYEIKDRERVKDCFKSKCVQLTINFEI